MKIVNEMSIANFKGWSGAVEIIETIMANNMVYEFDMLMEEIYPEGLTPTELNDLLWFDSQWVYESLGMEVEDELEELEELGSKMWGELTEQQQEALLEGDYDLYFINGNNEYLEIVFECDLKCKCRLIDAIEGEEIIIDEEELLMFI